MVQPAGAVLLVHALQDADASDALEEALAAEGVVCSHVPVLRRRLLPAPGAAEDLAQRVAASPWLIWTSPYAARALAAHGVPGRCAPSRWPSMIAVGPATAAAVKTVGWCGSPLLPEQADAEGVVEVMRSALTGPTRLVWPRSADARPTIERFAASAGHQLDAWNLYDTVACPEARARLSAFDLPPAVVVVTSSKTVTLFSAALEASTRARWQKATVVSIGPITSASARRLGWTRVVEADEASRPALVQAVLRALGELGEAGRGP